MKAHLIPYRKKFLHPLKGFREGILIEYGGRWGDIAPLEGWSVETLVESHREILKLLPHLEEATSHLPSVQFALECLQKPWPPIPFKKPLSALVWNSNIPLGYKTVKIKLEGFSPKEAIKKIKEIQKKGSYEIRIDINRSWSLKEALEFVAPFQPTDFAYLEEPVSTFKDLIRFSHLSSFPIAIDESFRQGCPWKEIPTLKAIIVKPSLIGRIPALPKEIDLILSGAYESSVGTAHIATLPTEKALGLDTYRYMKEDIFSPFLQIKKGNLVWGPASDLTDC